MSKWEINIDVFRLCIVFLVVFTCFDRSWASADDNIAPESISQDDCLMDGASFKIPDGISGRAAETMNSSGYTYVLITKGKEKIWVAGPTVAVKVGDEVAVSEGAVMNDFESKSLKRTFEKMVFVSEIFVNNPERTAAAEQHLTQKKNAALARCHKAFQDAETGNASTQLSIGNMYILGQEVTQDYKKAEACYRKAADNGSMAAQYFLGFAYYTGNIFTLDYQKAAHWFKKAAEQGDADAQNYLGSMYKNGQGVTQDDNQTAYWFSKAAEQGDVEAQFMLGLCYDLGKGVSQDYRNAAIWYTKSADQGNSSAQFFLGALYRQGKGVPQNYQQAMTLFTKAAEQGVADAQYSLGSMYGLGEGVPQNFGLMYVWASLAATSGDDNASQMRDLAATNLTPQSLSDVQTLAARLQEKINHPETPAVEISSSAFLTKTSTVEPTFSGTGSGFIISPEGHILTCAHVVKDASAIKVKLGERIMEAKTIRIDPSSDLALLKVSTPKPLSALPFAKARSATLGQDVFTIGFPNPELQGVAAKLTKGSVSSLSGVLDDPRLYQISVPVQPGNSGGPLLDNNGNVVGVVSAQMNDTAAFKSTGSLPQSINYAVKNAYALSLIDSLPEVAKKLPTPDSRSRTFAASVSAAESSVVLVLIYE